MPAGQTHNEKELLQLSAGGDESAFAQLFLQNRHKLFSFLMRLTQSPEATEDVIQDIFMKLWRNRSSLTEIESFSSYLFRMAQNQCITHFKRMAKETLILSRMASGASPSRSTTDEHLALKEVQEQLQQAVSKLTPQQKLVFTLSREKGLKYEEIAAELNISASTVKNHMIDALRIIRQHFHSSSNALLIGGLYILLDTLQKIK
ncbi:RNA polymerase sigma factor [Pseudobacter ginsenosidimutans]|uniref:RNA polymerase sigma factor n=1 Tax=Pseudobacter ginsenosidimutans TaxID=661488 RepID=UPI001315945E|nr:RNA polymerase sigma-70 factor [Pseudobacter ginsenosidimutans]